MTHWPCRQLADETDNPVVLIFVDADKAEPDFTAQEHKHLHKAVGFLSMAYITKKVSVSVILYLFLGGRGSSSSSFGATASFLEIGGSGTERRLRLDLCISRDVSVSS